MSQGVGLASCLPKTAWPPTFLSQRPTTVTRVEVEVPIGSLEYEDPRVVSALSTGGLKEPKSDRSHVVL